MPEGHPAATTRVVTAGLSVATALGIVAVLADDAEHGDAPGGGRGADAVRVVVPDGVDDEAARDAVREWLDRDGAPPPAPQVLRGDRVDTITRSS